MARIRVKSANEYFVSDEGINILIMKKPRQRYRTIIRTHLREMKRLKKLRQSYDYMREGCCYWSMGMCITGQCDKCSIRPNE